MRMTKSGMAATATSFSAPAEKLARQRLSVLELAQTLGSAARPVASAG